MIKFVQSGDFHLDSPLETFEDPDSRRLTLLDSFGQVIETVKEEKADLLLLTGDIFDNDSVRGETLDYLSGKLKEISGTKVLVSPGNHDWWGSSNSWQVLQTAGNLHVFQEFETILLEKPGVLIHGAGFRQRTESESLLPELSVLDHRFPNILLMHGEVAASSLYSPLDITELSRFDYCALGHRHEFQRLGPGGKIVYSGNPCARNFLETGEKGCVIATLEDGRLEVRFKALQFPGFHDLKLDVTGLMTHSAVREAIQNLIRSPGDYYRITLTGRNPLIHNLDYLKENTPAAGIRIVDESRKPRDLDHLKRETTLQGIFTRRMLELSDRDPLALDALEAGLDALEEDRGQ